MADKVNVLVVRGNRLELRQAEWEHNSLVDRKNRETYRIMEGCKPYQYRKGGKWVQAFLVSHKTATTFMEPDVVPQDLVLEGKRYKLTPEMVFELAVADDIRAYNQAGKINMLLIWLALGAGAAIMVFAWLGLEVFSTMNGGGPTNTPPPIPTPPQSLGAP